MSTEQFFLEYIVGNGITIDYKKDKSRAYFKKLISRLEYFGVKYKISGAGMNLMTLKITNK